MRKNQGGNDAKRFAINKSDKHSKNFDQFYPHS